VTQPPLQRSVFRIGSDKATPRQRLVAVGILAGSATVGLALLALDPVSTPYAPKCALHWASGYYCPGCGTGRALHALIAGRLRQAWAWNPLMVLMLPLLLAFLGEQLMRVVAGRRIVVERVPMIIVWTLTAMVILHGILRNVPLSIFDWMRPHGL
jgi:hypothetical protein